MFFVLRGADPGADGKTPRLQMNDIIFSTNNSAAVVLQATQSPHTKLYIDCGEVTSNTFLPTCQAFTVICLSPAASIATGVESWMHKSAYIVGRYLSNWSLTESRSCRLLIRPHTQGVEVFLGQVAGEQEIEGASLDDATLCSRYHLIGGIARSLFDDAYDDIDGRVTHAISSVDLDSIISGAKKDELDELPRDRFTSVIFHFRVNESPPLTQQVRTQLLATIRAAVAAGQRPPPLPFQLLHPHLQIATDELKEKLFQAHRDARLSKMARFLADSADITSLATIRGDMWQPFANHIIKSQPRLQRQRLDPVANARTGAVELHLFHVHAIAPLPIHLLTDFQQLADQQYGIPLPSNWPTLDAVLAPNITLQWTVSASHSVNEGGLYDAFQQLRLRQASLDAAKAALSADPTISAVTGAIGTRAATTAAAQLDALPPGSPAHASVVAAVQSAITSAYPVCTPAVSFAASTAAVNVCANFHLDHYFGVPREQFARFTLTNANFKPVKDKPRPANVNYYVLHVENAFDKKRKVCQQLSQPLLSITCCAQNHACVYALIKEYA